MKCLPRTITAVFALIQIPGISYAAVSQDDVNGFLNHTITSVPLSEPCTLVAEEIAFEDGFRLFDWKCEIDIDIGNNKILLPIQGVDLSRRSLDKNGDPIVSGRHTIFADGMRIINGAHGPCVEIRSDYPTIEISSSSQNRKLSVASGVKDVLVVKVTGTDSNVSISATNLGDSIFGEEGDPVNLKSQYAACSYGQLNISPAAQPSGASSLTIIKGVLEVAAPNPILGADPIDIVNDVINEMISQGIDIPGDFDHVMFCIPPGTGVEFEIPPFNWIAYAGINSWYSVYNNDWCTSVIVQMREIGYNLGLGHASEGSNEYDDRSGVMGLISPGNDSPKMCFNGPKSWQLGWYDSLHTTVDPLSTNWTGNLVGLAEYEDAAIDDTIVLKIETSTEVDYYVNFNRKTGINSGTQEGGDQVMITTQESETVAPLSLLHRKLNAGDCYTIPNFDNSGQSVTITVNSISTPTTYTVANVTVSSGLQVLSGVCFAIPSPATVAPAGASGDPHFKTWGGENYDFHGLCDLVLIKNHGFKNDLGMDIHIRTKKMNQWSYISNAVLRIGEDTLEVKGSNSNDQVHYWINSVLGDNYLTVTDEKIVSRYTLSGYPIMIRRLNLKSFEFTVDIGTDTEISLKTWNQLVRVDIYGGTYADFGTSSGLMGSFEAGAFLARDKKTIVKSINDFGQEWQVLSTEPVLFHNLEGPQHPEKCFLPSVTEMRRRLGESLMTQDKAKLACSHASKGDRDLCMFDVMATNDVGVAEAY